MSRFISFLKANKKALCAITLALIVTIIDQLSKAYVLENVSSVIAMLPILNIVKIYNTGISFGLFGGMAGGNLILSIMVLCVITVIWIWFVRYNAQENNISVGLITGGAIGNLIDRIIHPGVVDFIDFHWQTWHYPAFNIADSAIVIGVVILALRTISAD